MNTRKTLVSTWILVSAIAGCAQAQNTPAAAPPAVPATPTAPATSAPTTAAAESPAAEVDPILDALDKRGKELSDFTADVTLTDTDMANGTDSMMSGKMWMQKLPNDDARLRVSFDRKVRNDKAEKIRQEYVLAGGQLTDRDYTASTENIYQVLEPGQKMNLLKLGEGPFPLPLGQDKADVHKMFQVTMPPKTNDDPTGLVHVRLVPRPGTRFADKFASIDFWVDLTNQMPVLIKTEDPNQTTLRTTELKNVTVNSKLDDKQFALEPVDESKWRITRQSYQD